ncbi:MAG: tRNA (N(6)-L-threonylcarbamoyladenosine(37)-C(2))-methylthiotransferase MtaB [Eubacteriales bacterium]
MKIGFYTLGCKVNQYETEAMEELFRQRGHTIVPPGPDCDVCVINTCTVTGISDRKCRQIIRRARQDNPGCVLAVTGCYSQTHPAQAASIPGVDIVTGTGGRAELPSLVERFLAERRPLTQVSDARQHRDFEALSIGAFEGHTRASLKIQDGCDNFCSYCIIPYARGPVRSRPLPEILSEARRLLEAGFVELVLTGIHLCSYGKDTGSELLDVLEALDRLPGTFRLRLGSLEPSYFTPERAARLAALGHLCPHFHLSLQSGCDRTLRAMNRHYTSEQFRQSAALLRQALPGATLTTDVIVGFPGETPEDFALSAAFVEEMEFLQCHVFPYSPREGTPAARMSGQIPGDEKHRRAAEMSRRTGLIRCRLLEKQVGRTLPVLFEMFPQGDLYEGFSPEYYPVRVSSPQTLSRQVRQVLITGVEGDALTGRLV